eukprot:SAG11_NODE_14128_length_623_cov_0.843810_1_plen_34_part_10
MGELINMLFTNKALKRTLHENDRHENVRCMRTTL